MKVYITKHALAKGIIQFDVEQVTSAIVRHKDETGKVTTYYPDEWHMDSVKAIARAEEMRAERIKVCERTIQILQAISFEIGNQKIPKYKYNRNIRVLQLSYEGKLIKEYESATTAAATNGFNVNGILRCCRGYCKTYKEYKWKYK